MTQNQFNESVCMILWNLIDIASTGIDDKDVRIKDSLVELELIERSIEVEPCAVSRRDAEVAEFNKHVEAHNKAVEEDEAKGEEWKKGVDDS